MKAVFVGGGAFRTVGILRGALAERQIFSGGEINLYDLNPRRSEATGQMLARTPEYARVNCKLTWGTSLQHALEGADMVGVILMAGSQKTAHWSDEISLRHGMMSSDNVSPSGSFLAVKGGPILLNVARQMEKYCPNAWLVDFANPVAVHSGMINNHTRIKTLGVCAGYTNHQWDLARLFGKDEQSSDFDVEAAGINHLSFIMRGTRKGKELFHALDRHLANNWRMCKLQSFWSQGARRNITRSVKNLIRFYRDLGVLIYSTEGDGMAHLHYDELLAETLAQFKPSTAAQITARLKRGAAGREQADREFRSCLDMNLDQEFWDTGWQRPGMDWARRQDHDIFVEVLRGLAGVRPVKVVTSRLNKGAVEGFSDRTVLEYTQYIEKGQIRPAGRYQLPGVVHGLISSLATHQTMLGDAIATDDPRLLAHALLAYPIRQFAPSTRTLYRELARINQDEMPKNFRRVTEYL